MFPKFKKFKQLFCRSLLVVSLLSLPIQAMNNANGSNNGSLKKYFQQHCLPFLTFGAFHFGSITAHEYGHKITGELLLGNSGTIHLTLNGAHTTFSKPFEFENWRTLAIFLAGPAAGIAASLCLLKLSNIIDEYCNGKSFLTAVNEGFKKPFFFYLGNDKRSMLISRFCALVQIGMNLYNLVPYQSTRIKSGASDGYLAMKTIKTILYKTPKVEDQIHDGGNE